MDYPVEPVIPVLPSPPVPKAGVVQRVATIAKTVKLHPNYTEAIGEDLGIIGSEQFIDWSEIKPTLKLKVISKKVIINFDKDLSDGVNIYGRRDNETDWIFLATDTEPPYYDTRPNLVAGKAETREYKAVYVLNDEEVSIESEIYSILVKL